MFVTYEGTNLKYRNTQIWSLESWPRSWRSFVLGVGSWHQWHRSWHELAPMRCAYTLIPGDYCTLVLTTDHSLDLNAPIMIFFFLHDTHAYQHRAIEYTHNAWMRVADWWCSSMVQLADWWCSSALSYLPSFVFACATVTLDQISWIRS